jgi:crossover junction endodeoxyribonuclease RuvC
MRIVGIDPGVSGGLVLLNGRQIEDMLPMPTVEIATGKHRRREIVEDRVADALRAWKPDHAMIEKVHSMPDQGTASMFSFGAGWGLVRGVCAGLGIPRELIPPQTWKKIMLAGYPKDAEELVARQLWPRADWTVATTKAGRGGLYDAALIAEAGRRRMEGGKP